MTATEMVELNGGTFTRNYSDANFMIHKIGTARTCIVAYRHTRRNPIGHPILLLRCGYASVWRNIPNGYSQQGYRMHIR